MDRQVLLIDQGSMADSEIAKLEQLGVVVVQQMAGRKAEMYYVHYEESENNNE